MLKQFFILCSGADASLLSKCNQAEQTKYVGIGATIFFTAVMAFVSSAYALFTVFDNYYISAVFGLIWALMIFNLDRFIVSTLKKRTRFASELLQASPRILLAVIIAIVISKPLELKIFEKEIDTVLRAEQNKLALADKREVANYFSADLKRNKEEVNRLRTQLNNKEREVNSLYETYISEAEGTKGTLKIGKGPVFKEKVAKYALAKVELDSLRKLNELELKKLASEAEKLRLDEAEKIAAGAPTIAKYDGLMARLNALGKLPLLPSAFLMLLFLCVETAPILTKLFTPKGMYDYFLEEDELFAKSRITQQIQQQQLLDKTLNDLQTEAFTHLKVDDELVRSSRRTAREAIENRLAMFAEKNVRTQG